MKTKRMVQITWMDSDGNAAGIGLDELIETDWTLDECIEAARYRGECDGVDLDRFHVEVEELD